MTGSPISDLNPIFMAAGIMLNLCSQNRGFRTIKMDNTFFVGYRRNIIAPDEVLISIEIPYSTSVIKVLYKVMWSTNVDPYLICTLILFIFLI